MSFRPVAAAFAALLLAGTFASAASAKVLRLPDEDAVATIKIPDSWKPEEIDDGIQAQSPDSAVYLSVEVGDAGNLKDLVENTFAYLKKNKVRIDEASQKETEGTINGMPMKDLSWSGRDRDGATTVGVSFISVTSEKVLMITHWASPEGEKKYEDVLVDVLRSIAPAH